MRPIQFKVFGYKTEIQYSFLFLALFYWMNGMSRGHPLWFDLTFIAVVFISIIVHELGHAFLITNRGFQVNRIALHGLGGDVTGNHGRAKPQDRLLISIAGPAAGLALGLPFLILQLLGIFDASYVIATVITMFVWVNIIWSLFNLLPMLPLDGGHAFSSLLKMFRVSKPLSKSSYLGIITGIIVMIIGIRMGRFFLAFIGGYCAYYSYRQYVHIGKTKPTPKTTQTKNKEHSKKHQEEIRQKAKAQLKHLDSQKVTPELAKQVDELLQSVGLPKNKDK